MTRIRKGKNWLAQSLAKLNPLIAASALLLLGSLLSIIIAFRVAESSQSLIQSKLNSLSKQVKVLLSERLAIYERGLIGVRSAIIASDEKILESKNFSKYVNNLNMHRTFPGAHGFGFVRRVSEEQEEKFLLNYSSDGVVDFSISKIAQHAGDRWIIERIEPFNINRNAIGLDLASEEKRRLAINFALKNNKSTLTPPLTLMQALDKPNMGLLFLVPVQGSKTNEQIEGFVHMPLLIDEVLRGQLIDGGDFVISLSDISSEIPVNLFFTNKSINDVLVDGLVKVTNLDVYGRKWQVKIQGTKLFVNRLSVPSAWGAGLRVFFVSILLSLLLYMSLLHIRKQGQTLSERTTELNRARRDLQTVFDAVPSLISYWDGGLRNRMANNAFLPWFGIGPSRMEGMRMREALGEAFYLRYEEHVKAVLAGQPQSFEASIQRSDGQTMLAIANLIPDLMDGVQRGFYLIAHDVTEFKFNQSRLEQVLRENDVLLSTLNQQLLYSVTDAKGLIVEVNDNFCGISGYSREELIGNTHSLINSGEHSRLFWTDVWRKIATGEAWHGEVCNRAKDGSLYWVDTVIAPFIGANGKVERYVSMRTDVTVRHLLDDSLREAKVVAETASQAKSEFLANMSHEIRTPMNGILGFAYLLERQNMSPSALSMVQKIQGASQSLLGIIDDILDVSKIEAGRLTLDESAFDLGEVIEQIASLMSGSVTDRSIDLYIDAPPKNARFLIGDMVRLVQILRNLVSNALKFTYSGKVSVNISEISRNNTNDVALLRFSVKDSGIGIDGDKLENIFSSFSQGDTTITRRFGGTGLGLTISQSLAGLMGGHVSVTSEVGIGSEFVLEVPLRLNTSFVPAKTYMPALKTLIACDETSMERLKVSAENLGWQADFAVSGADMLEKFVQQPDYDIVLADWSLPDMNGLSALTDLLASHADHRPPVTLITVSPQSTDALRSHASCDQIDSILIKPVTDSALQNTVSNVLNHRQNSSFTALRLGAKLPGVRILLVDDSQLNLEVAEHILCAEGAIVRTCDNGKMAVDLLAEQADAFDIVLMDVQMPVMDGFTATREIRQTLAIHHLPIVALTAGALSTQKQIALDSGMNDFITKPFVVDELVAIVKKLVARALPKAIAPDSQAMAPVGVADTAEQELMAGDEWQAIMDRFRSRFFDERIPAFQEAFAAISKQESDDWQEGLKFLIHKLAGEAGFVGYHDISDLSKRIEQCWDEYGLCDEVSELMQQLSVDLAELS